MTQGDFGPQFKFGEGRISGWISVSLGVLSVLGVLCFHFPDVMTTPELRQVYTANEMRYLLYAGMIFSVAFGLVTFVLNRKKLMGAVGITLALLALWGGGISMEVGPRYDLPGYIGVDWFILDLLLSTMIFIFLEKLFPHIREQAILRPDWWHDFRYFALNHLLIGIFAVAATMTAPTFFSWAVNHGSFRILAAVDHSIHDGDRPCRSRRVCDPPHLARGQMALANPRRAPFGRAYGLARRFAAALSGAARDAGPSGPAGRGSDGQCCRTPGTRCRDSRSPASADPLGPAAAKPPRRRRAARRTRASSTNRAASGAAAAWVGSTWRLFRALPYHHRGSPAGRWGRVGPFQFVAAQREVSALLI